MSRPTSDDGHEDGRGPIGRLADVFVFAPLGLAVEARALWPDLADRGRRTLGDARDHALGALEGLGLGSGVQVDERLPATGPDVARPAAPPTPRRVPPPDVPEVEVTTLAIPDYDSLSASQVVPRLDGLQHDELEQVRWYELGNRGRKTILNKIAQLESG